MEKSENRVTKAEYIKLVKYRKILINTLRQISL